MPFILLLGLVALGAFAVVMFAARAASNADDRLHLDLQGDTAFDTGDVQPVSAGDDASEQPRA